MRFSPGARDANVARMTLGPVGMTQAVAPLHRGEGWNDVEAIWTTPSGVTGAQRTIHQLRRDISVRPTAGRDALRLRPVLEALSRNPQVEYVTPDPMEQLATRAALRGVLTTFSRST
jgi:hypothetical protein